MGNSVVHLVDDEPAVRATHSRLLNSDGYCVEEHASGARIIAAAGSLKSGCIPLDTSMPEPDGFAVRRELAEKSVDLPIIMMTGSGDLTMVALKAGVADFMQKSLGRAELLAGLDQISSADQHD